MSSGRQSRGGRIEGEKYLDGNGGVTVMKENGKEAGLGREGLHGQHGLEKVSGDPEGTPEQRRLARGALHRQTRPGSRAREGLGLSCTPGVDLEVRTTGGCPLTAPSG